MRGIYHTKQRDVIEEYLERSGGAHFTLDDAAEALRREGVGRTTVYRYLERLAAENRVRKILSGERAVCYQYAKEPEECHVHFHLICTDCGKLVHLKCDHLREVSGHLEEEHHFSVDMEKTQFYGLCAECRKGSEG